MPRYDYPGYGPTGENWLTARPIQPTASVFATGAPPIPYLQPDPRGRPSGILGMLIDAGHIDPVNPDQPAPGGLLGLIQDYLRSNPSAGR